MHTLTISELTKNFENKTVLDYIAFECRTGDIIGILGRNGTGKSTILKAVSGTLKADTIRLSVDGKAIPAREIIPQQKIAYLPQDPFVPKSLKIRDITAIYFKDGDIQDKILYDPLVARMANTKAGSLSMGELRYFELMLISTLPHPFLLLDEPFSMIEPLYRERIKEKLISLKTTKGIIMTDHYYYDILETANKCVLLKNGRLISVNSIEDLAGNGYLPASNY